MKKTTLYTAPATEAVVKALLYLQLALQALDLHSTLSRLGGRTEMNKAILAISAVTGMAPAVILMKALSVAAVWLLYKQWQKLPKPNAFDIPVVAVFAVFNTALMAIVFNNYRG